MTELPVYGSGRIGMHKPAYGQTLYEVTDHLGNVRAVIGGSVQTTMLATMENERKEKESVDFFGMHTTVTATDINHTMAAVTVDGETDIVDPNEVIRLNNRPNGRYSPNPIGGGTMLWVHPGDTVRAEVFAKYARIGQTSNRNQLVALAAMLQSLSPIDNAAEMRKAFQMLSRSEFRALPVWGKLDDAQPPAFLNGLLFDKDMKLQTFDFDQVSDQARIKAVHDTTGHEKLALEFVPEKEGYLYIYISNESKENLDVYFDDLKVTQVYGTVVAGGDYYPYGLPIEDRQITLEDYRFGYQGQFAEEDEETGWNHFELREYDAVIGRWLVPDPYGEYWSPYIAMGNNPINLVDPNGGKTGPKPGDIKNNKIFDGTNWLQMSKVAEVEGSWSKFDQWLYDSYESYQLFKRGDGIAFWGSPDFFGSEIVFTGRNGRASHFMDPGNIFMDFSKFRGYTIKKTPVTVLEIFESAKNAYDAIDKVNRLGNGVVDMMKKQIHESVHQNKWKAQRIQELRDSIDAGKVRVYGINVNVSRAWGKDQDTLGVTFFDENSVPTYYKLK